MKKQKWFSRRVGRDLFVLTVLAASVAGAIILFTERNWRTISEQYIENETKRADSKFQDMATDVEGSLGMVRDWGISGRLDSSKVDAAKGWVAPFFEKHKALSGISIADTDGNGFFMLPDGTLSQPAKEGLYNPAERPWFNPALDAEGCHWTGIYFFQTLGQPGITASVSWPRKKGKGQTVAAFDILLADFFSEVQKMTPTPNGRAFVFLPDRELYVPASDSATAEFRSIDLVKDELVRQGLSLWNDEMAWDDNSPWTVGKHRELKVLKLRHNRETWWCGFAPLEKSRQLLWMGVLVPESDIVRDIARRRKMNAGIGIVVFLVLAVPYAFFVRQRVSIGEMDVDMDERQVRTLIRKGENRSVEFKSTMRMNLHAKKPGKEIELAWLKGVAGFLNTDGGILLLGVADDGEITGIEADVFENEDKCRLHFKNLVSAHIGTELSKYIRFLLVPVAGKTVGVVLCARAREPVFVKNGNKEHFYIRNGPSSDELSVSQALNYIKGRK